MEATPAEQQPKVTEQPPALAQQEQAPQSNPEPPATLQTLLRPTERDDSLLSHHVPAAVSTAQSLLSSDVPTTDDDNDVFSDMSSETASLTDSINSTNYQYRYQSGRRYHGFEDAVYLLPNDEREQERLENQHLAWIMAMGGKLHWAPIKHDVQSILDIATGTGNWAMDIADQYPSAKVVGTDLSPIQPNLHRSVPPNCTFIVEDSEQDWMWGDERFEYIHSRTLGSTWKDWPGYFAKCMEFLQPGGYLELHEFTFPFHCDDGSCDLNNPFMHWSALFNQGAAKAGVDMEQCANLDPWIREAGFIEVTKHRLRMPFTGWPEDTVEKKCGEFYGRTFDWGVSIALLTKRLGWSEESAQVFLADVRKEAVKKSNHVYIPLYVYTARKPLNAAAH